VVVHNILRHVDCYVVTRLLVADLVTVTSIYKHNVMWVVTLIYKRFVIKVIVLIASFILKGKKEN
jgi:hypothetical protein